MDTNTSWPAAPAADLRLQKIVLVVGRLGLAFVFFTQLWWKLPPTFGCTNDFAFPRPAVQNYWDGNGSGGLCFWLGMETIYANQPRKVLVSDMRPAGLPNAGIDIRPLAQVNAALLENLVKPSIAFAGWLIWLAEFTVFVSLLLGLLTRLGGLIAIGVSLQLYIGLANIPRPYEWEWSYGLLVLLSIVMFGLAPGRVFGIDARLRRHLATRAGSRFARFASWIT